MPKSINALMKYLRDVKGIAISGSSQKKILRNYGYYHAYKGYRYIRNSENKQNFANFEELASIYDFDSQLKSLFYPTVMFLETALKNHVLEEVIEYSNSGNLIDIYNKVLTNHQSKKVGSSEYRKAMKKRLDLRQKLYAVQAEKYDKRPVATHFIEQDRNMPIWAIFELLTLGEFGNFVSCINTDCRIKISANIGFRPCDDTTGTLPANMIFTLQPLRNAIAHNSVIFDVRFKDQAIPNTVSNVIQTNTNIPGITFNSITDYVVLIVYLEKLLGVSKTELKCFVNDYVDLIEKSRKKIPFDKYSQIIYTDNRNKISALKKFISA